jgi:DMSO/TMAO reductase YedYZ heme-binding membrane subunit
MAGAKRSSWQEGRLDWRWQRSAWRSVGAASKAPWLDCVRPPCWRFPFLVGAYAAAALAALWPGKFSEWLVARRRSFGLTFSAVFSVHLVLIARFLSLPPNPPPTALGLVLGFVAYMLLAGMVLTSFSRIAKALGSARVHLLRRVGEQWVFAVFALTLINGASKHSALWLVPLLIVMAAYAMRLKVWARDFSRLKRAPR